MSQTINDILDPIAERLNQAGISHALREARLIIAHALNEPYEMVYFHPGHVLNQDQLITIGLMVERRCQLEPLAKILGRKEFWGLDFFVTKDTLDPRPDSETLIESLLAHFPEKNHPLRFLDLGTGSGCLITAALKEYPCAWAVAVDKSIKALHVASTNLLTLGVKDRCQLICCDWATALIGQFDAILCNPPYISRQEKLCRQTLHDPEMALFAENNGLAAYEQLAKTLSPFMHSDSYLFLEVGATQKSLVERIFTQHAFHLLHTRWDLQGKERCLIFKKSEA